MYLVTILEIDNDSVESVLNINVAISSSMGTI